jgi:hypothetical protein
MWFHFKKRPHPLTHPYPLHSIFIPPPSHSTPPHQVAVLGYVIWGNGVGKSITLNVSAGITGTINNVLILLLPFTKYALTLEPIGQDLAKKIAGLLKQVAAVAAVAAVEELAVLVQL